MIRFDRRRFLASGAAGAAFAAGTVPALAQSERGSAALRALLDTIFADDLIANPQDATGYGLDKGRYASLRSQLDRRGAAARVENLARNRAWLARLDRFDQGSLDPAGLQQLRVARYMIEQRVLGPERFGIDDAQRPYPISQRNGAYFSIPNFLDSQHPIENRSDAEAYLVRLVGFAGALDQDTAEQRAQAARGFLAPGWTLDLTLEQMGKLRGVPAAESGMVQSLARRAAAKGIAGDWAGQAARLVEREVHPALDRQIAMLRELRPTTAPGDGAQRLPRGDEIYALALKQATTTELTPDEVHRIGLDQVAEIQGQLDPILRRAALSEGSLGARLTALNERPDQLYPDTAAGRRQLIADLNASEKAMEARLGRAFADPPRKPLDIRAVPVEIQDGASNGYYYSAALDGSRPAIYWINLKSVGDWPKYTLPALTYHEGVPGHHLQGGYAQAAGDLPLLLSNYFISAYGEGWALYAEEVADRLGGYKGIERAGYLQSFLFRASRLVVDTGLHSKGWSREQATDYMVEATGFARPRTQREVERYCTQIGQACSYKIGHTAWVRAREKAQAALGPRFDDKWFHGILAEGVMPLSMFEKRNDERIAERLRVMGA
ncbi:MAG: DUF885 family protein [Novosphingobium sp.]|nr:DUF885 family protein [Novosphingobium sp.]